jgi:hypothetical protein
MSILNRVIVLGDSYTFGHGCSDRVYYYDEDLKKFVGDSTPMELCIPSEYCWPALLQKEFPRLKVHNLSQPGNCNQAMFRNLLDFYANYDYNLNDLIIFNGTFSDRIEVRTMHDFDKVGPWAIGWEYMNTNRPTSTYKEYIDAQKHYVKHLYHEKIGFNLTLSSLLGAYSYSILNKHDFLYSLADEGHPSIKPNIRCINNHEIPKIFEYDFSGENNYQFNVTCQAKDTHTNEKGHQIYYEKEIKPRIQKML